jgi:hypothetical protein
MLRLLPLLRRQHTRQAATFSFREPTFSTLLSALGLQHPTTAPASRSRFSSFSPLLFACFRIVLYLPECIFIRLFLRSHFVFVLFTLSPHVFSCSNSLTFRAFFTRIRMTRIRSCRSPGPGFHGPCRQVASLSSRPELNVLTCRGRASSARAIVQEGSYFISCLCSRSWLCS